MPTSGFTLKVIKTTQQQSKINLAYINKNIKASEDDLMLVDSSYLYAFDKDSSIPSDSIALSRIQREFLNKSIKFDTIEIDFIDKKYIGNINIIKFSIEIVNLTTVEFDASSLKALIKDTYRGFPFNLSQKLFFHHQEQDVILTLTVTEMICEDRLPYAIMTEEAEISLSSSSSRVSLINNQADNMLLKPNFSFEHLEIGGLKKEFEQMFRRAFVQRLFEPAVMKKFGLPHVKGIMLYGPPGTGKTLIARQLGTLLNAKPPKIVNGPEILNKYVGQSEENIRNLFKDAEDEFKAKREESQLHIIIFDEIDAICKRRGTGGSAGVNDQVVNQLLSKIDGVEALDNILVIGMTNRLDLIDEALLRPGRFEIHLEITLPDEEARFEIFQIHTKKMNSNKFLDEGIDFKRLAMMAKNYTGAEIAAVVRAAGSYALERKVKTDDKEKLVTDEDIKVSMSDMLQGLDEIKPAFGLDEKNFETFNKIFYETSTFNKGMCFGKELMQKLQKTNLYNTNSLLLYGARGVGKTTLAARIALQSGFPFIKIISPFNMVGLGENEKVNYIKETFMNAYKSEEAVIILDDIEGLIEYVGIGPRFSNSVLQAIKIFIKTEGKKKLFVLGTTSMPAVLSESGIFECFEEDMEVGLCTKLDFETLCEQNSAFKQLEFVNPIPFKKLLGQLPEPDVSLK